MQAIDEEGKPKPETVGEIPNPSPNLARQPRHNDDDDAVASSTCSFGLSELNSLLS